VAQQAPLAQQVQLAQLVHKGLSVLLAQQGQFPKVFFTQLVIKLSVAKKLSLLIVLFFLVPMFNS
jgi:hypothetical protein